MPEKNITGRKTDRGQTLIRFGYPRGRVRIRGEFTKHKAALIPSRELWFYSDFQMFFDDQYLSRNYSFAWGGVDGLDGKQLFEEKIRKEPERYTFPREARRLNLPHVIAQFRDSDDSSRTRLEIYWSISKSSLLAAASSGQRLDLPYLFQSGVFFFDHNWNEVRSWQGRRRLMDPTSIVSTDSLMNDLTSAPNDLIDRWSVRMPPGNYYLAVEAIEKKSGCYGTVRDTIRIENFSGNQLRMSSLVLANAINKITTVNGDTNISLAINQRREINLTPNFYGKFLPTAPICVYYEVYNLTLEANGQSRYRIDYVAESQPEKSGVFSNAIGSLAKLFGLNGYRVAISSSFESVGSNRTEELYHSFRILGRPAGQYRLTIRVTDRVSGQSISRDVTFYVNP